MCIDNCDFKMICYLMSHRNTMLFDDWWIDEDQGTRWMSLYEMVDKLNIIMRCSVKRILGLILYVWFLHVMLYMW